MTKHIVCLIKNKINTVFLLAGMLLLGTSAHAQFSKPVIVLKGTVRAAQTGKAQPVKISIRSAKQKDLEISNSQSNSLTGNYLVILQPKTKYLVRLESTDVIAKEELIETPAVTDATIEITKNFIISKISVKDVSEQKAESEAEKEID